MKVVVVGAGEAGTACALALRERGADVLLLEAAAAIDAAAAAALGGSVRPRARVVGVSEDGVRLASGEHVAADAVVLTAGLAATPALARRAGWALPSGPFCGQASEQPRLWACTDPAAAAHAAERVCGQAAKRAS